MAKSKIYKIVESQTSAELETVRRTLRALRLLGVRFSETKIDGAATTIHAWTETAEPRAQHTNGPPTRFPLPGIVAPVETDGQETR